MSKKDKLLILVKESVQKCYENDFVLIERSMEQASVARIYYYMQRAIEQDEHFQEFREYNLDSEYNKNGDHIKCTPRCTKGTRPDIILHKRGGNDGNLLVVEFKPRKARIRIHKDEKRPIDVVKLEDFTLPEVYHYFLGVYVKLNKRRVIYTYFQDGHIKAKEDLHDE